MKIEQLTCPRGDWTVLLKDGDVYYTGHSIPDFVWQKLLSDLGCKITERVISSRSMEEGKYT